MKTYSSFEVCDILGIHHDRLREWMRGGFIKPTIAANGQGTRAVFSENDLKQIGKFMKLVDSGYHRKAAARLAVK